MVENYNQIDNQLSNIPHDPEEKKEPKHEKTVRIEEHKKTRNRMSMKEKLSEKKVEIAERDSKAHEAEKAKKSPSMGMDD